MWTDFRAGSPSWTALTEKERDEVRNFLEAHDVDVNAVWRVEFGLKSMTIHQFEYDTEGRPFLRNEDIASQLPQRIRYAPHHERTIRRQRSSL